MNFQGARAKLTIGSLDTDLSVEAQYNPKELAYDKPVPWLEHQDMNLEYQGIKSRSLTVELFFDGFETNESIQDQIDALEELSSPRDKDSRQNKMLRPHRCVVLWGDAGMPRMRVVVEDLNVKYIAWHSNGRPLRATCTVKLKECAVNAAEVRAEQAQLDRATAATRRRAAAR